VTEQERQRAIRQRLSRGESRVLAPIATGFSQLDAALGIGGLPRGWITEIFGGSGSGKTTLALQIVAHAQQNGCTGAWLDAEHSFDAAYAGALGITLEGMPLSQPESAEQALEIARQLAVSGAVDLVVIDSAAALAPRIELETGLGGAGHGLHSRVLASGLRRLAASLQRTAAAALILNQMRSRNDSADSQSETSAGGAPLKLYAAVRMALEAGGGPTGPVRFRILKNKAGAAFVEGELRRQNGLGFAKSP
jgi:recombination protein RecA